MKVFVLEKKNFRKLKTRLGKTLSGLCCEKEEIAFTIKAGDESFIIINEDANLTENELNIVLNHELAHVEGIENEEMADRRAMEFLTDIQKDILINNWNIRHGKDFQ